jgi:hypothetical protein
MTWKTLIWAFVVGLTSCAAVAQAGESSANVEFYFDSNIGIAFADFPFPGASLLGGVRRVSDSGFVFEAEAGLAFPTVVTGKVGLGIQRFEGGPSGTIGLRLWPLHAYYQQSIPTKRCERTLSERAQSRLQRRGKDRNNLRCSDWYFTLEVGANGSISFDSQAIISVGHRLFFD